MEQEKFAIEMDNGKVVVISSLPFDGDIDVDSILKIDYSNILGEILTFPVLFNRIANLRAEMQSIVSMAKLDFDLFEAQLTEEHQKKLNADREGARKATIKDIETAVFRDKRYILKKRDFFAKEKSLAYLEALYWSAQSKDTKLNRLSDKLRPEEFERDIIEDTINGVQIKLKKKVIS